MTTERLRNTRNSDRVELKYCGKNQLQCHILSTKYPRWEVFEMNLGLRDQSSATNRLSHGTAFLEVRLQ